ncbi:hypothetical protein [Nonomuraea endophytica]|uniref:CU044_5270 family protein n=1 Tax=Nonomuraea endophytica TaxID=714136 RepID=A0A7W8A5Y6_9ACTN|nr:hypothetical protein [Nonomuraea endophytica]MBB5080212.1 hypothetical protein [Nonomuraea endophytica]
MDDEIRTFAEGRPAAPPYPEGARSRAREELVRAARGGRGGFRLPRLGWQSVAAFGVTVLLVGGVAGALAREEPGMVASPGGLDPQPGQYIVVESQGTEGGLSQVWSGVEGAVMKQVKRQVWLTASGTEPVYVRIETQPSQSSPAPEEPGTRWLRLGGCPESPPTPSSDPAALRAQLAEPDGNPEPDPAAAAFDRARGMIVERYLTKERLDALIAALKEIPGVRVADGVADMTGRTGIGIGLVYDGVLQQLIFDPVTSQYMGLRHTVVDEKEAEAPEGSVLALTAQLGMRVADTLPEVDGQLLASCSQDKPAASASPTLPPPPEATPANSPPPTATPTAETLAPTPDPSSVDLEASLEPTPIPTGS